MKKQKPTSILSVLLIGLLLAVVATVLSVRSNYNTELDPRVNLCIGYDDPDRKFPVTKTGSAGVPFKEVTKSETEFIHNCAPDEVATQRTSLNQVAEYFMGWQFFANAAFYTSIIVAVILARRLYANTRH